MSSNVVESGSTIKWNEKTGAEIYDFLINKTGFVSKSGYGLLGYWVIREMSDPSE